MTAASHGVIIFIKYPSLPDPLLSLISLNSKSQEYEKL